MTKKEEVKNGRKKDRKEQKQPGWYAYASRFINAAIFLDQATVHNGCLEVAANYAESTRPSIDEINEKQKKLKSMEYLPIEVPAGAMLVFEATLRHRSLPNTLGGLRRVLYLTFNSRAEGDHRNDYFSDKRYSMSRKNSVELKKALAKVSR